ncbi:MAG TPA: cohesin domain-containing protein, partial [Bacteroidales bacterium]|nr:cohesin domain-containing protein [Bacteroidales bacterium]
MKKCILLLLLTCFWLTAKTQNPTAIIQTVSGAPGSTVAVNINVSNFTWGIAAMQYSIHYDSSIVRYVSTANWFPGLNGVSIYPQADSTSLTVVWGDMNAVYINNILCTMSFKIKKAGCSAITWSDVPTLREWADGNYLYYDGNDHPAIAYTNGQVCACSTATITLTSAPATTTQTTCINTAITNITYSTTGATGATFTGLPAGVTGSWAANVVTITGSPTATGTYTYTVTLVGACTPTTANGTITVSPNNTVTAASSTPTLCINTALTAITHTTTGATGIGAATGLPAGVTAAWAANTITIS